MIVRFVFSGRQPKIAWWNINSEFQKRNTSSGAILASGRSGRETTLWTEQKEFFDKKILFYVFKPI